LTFLIDDKDVWHTLDTDDLWIYDKLILAKKLGYKAAPAGVPVDSPNWYIVRPITNLRMMSRGAAKQWLTPNDVNAIPDGYFWCEFFTGDHISVDYHYGQQHLCVQGFRNSDRLDRFCRWTKIDKYIPVPLPLKHLAEKYEWINVEFVGGNPIEVHARYNDDFTNHSCNTIIPVWKNEPIDQPPGSSWYESPSAERLGFWIY
jgi:hypothetical protein